MYSVESGDESVMPDGDRGNPYLLCLFTIRIITWHLCVNLLPSHIFRPSFLEIAVTQTLYA